MEAPTEVLSQSRVVHTRYNYQGCNPGRLQFSITIDFLFLTYILGRSSEAYLIANPWKFLLRRQDGIMCRHCLPHRCTHRPPQLHWSKTLSSRNKDPDLVLQKRESTRCSFLKSSAELRSQHCFAIFVVSCVNAWVSAASFFVCASQMMDPPPAPQWGKVTRGGNENLQRHPHKVFGTSITSEFRKFL